MNLRDYNSLVLISPPSPKRTPSLRVKFSGLLQNQKSGNFDIDI